MDNDYFRIGVLPEIGGRIFSAIDKTKTATSFLAGISLNRFC
jgi:hypothetical protein